MEGQFDDFQDDWELLLDPTVEATPDSLDDMEGDSEGMIRADYFSIDGSKLYAKPLIPSEDLTDSAESENPSWVDPGYDSQFADRNPGEPWSDSGSDLSEGRKFSDFSTVEGKRDDGAGLEGLVSKHGDAGFGFDGAKLSDFDAEKLDAADELRSERKEAPIDEAEVVVPVDKVEVGSERGRIAWWKVPFEVLRYCVLRVGPAWSFSVAAAMVGLVILGHRLHKMKQKSRTLLLKVTLDDKKVSHFMSRTARLNEAFSVVRRVPVVRPVLPVPAAGVTPSWSMMSLR
ncbi:hypothetical protein SAY87_020829 [Trapa incisa]|uniref:DUF6821 domain-containing protein n=1 Tax=Trapa incisa TaxID=236973 RepID=A0AAN7JQZ7_9MYRT|nr:hypothetical protein SAY87_020829 [Trapa incisa]